MKLPLALLLLPAIALAQFPSLSPSSTIEQQIGSTQVRVVYERPATRGRKIFGSLVPYKELWRTGAGNCTKVSFSEKVVIGKTSVEPGTYSLFTIPDVTSWTIILNKDTSLYGTGNYSESKDVLRLNVPVQSSSRTYESFTIDIDIVPNNLIIYLSWVNTQVGFAVQTIVDKVSMDFITEELLTGKSKDPQAYGTAAEYLYYLGRDPDVALDLVQRGLALKKEPWLSRLKSDIIEQQKKTDRKE